MKYIEKYLKDIIKVKPLGKLTTEEDELDGISGEMVYIDGKCSNIFISHIDYANWLEKQGEKDVRQKFLEDLLVADDIYQMSMNEAMVEEARTKAINALSELEISKLLGIEKQGEQKLIDKVRPKFHRGEWITNGDYTWKIVEVKPLDYILQSQDGDIVDDTISHVDEQFHSFTIQDAKEGDVLYAKDFYGDCVFIFNGLDKWKFDEPSGDRAVATGHCCITISSKNIEFGTQGPDCVEVDTVNPATKEQRDILFQKMKKEGYVWDSREKELRKVEQNPTEWSEEDERNMQNIDSVLFYDKTLPEDTCIKLRNFLKTLRQRCI